MKKKMILTLFRGNRQFFRQQLGSTTETEYNVIYNVYNIVPSLRVPFAVEAKFLMGTIF
jgi:hypothetical protein